MNKDTALRLALEALTKVDALCPVGSNEEIYVMEAIYAIKAALEAKDEPVAFRLKSETVDYQVTCYSKEQADIYINDMGWQLIEVLYTTPPQRTWAGLTEDDKVLIKHDADFNQFISAGEYADRVQALTEARLKDKNT